MKKITIINGMADESYLTFEEDLNRILDKYKDRIEFEDFHIRNMNIKYCCGCFGCWLKTPGKCIQVDEMPGILKSVIHSDLTIFISPVHMGFVSSNIKKVNDKMVPLIHPYVGIFNGECHHIKRYDKYPKLGLILVDKKSQSRESHGIITGIYERLAIILRQNLLFQYYVMGLWIVMEFIEKLEPLRESLHRLKLGFVVHSGFPEAVHSRHVGKYLKWLASDLDAEYIGTVVMGGSEGIRATSPSMLKGRRALINELGRRLPSEGKFNADIVKKAVGMERMSKIVALLVKVITKTGVINSMWNSQLKNNNAYNDRFARPYDR